MSDRISLPVPKCTQQTRPFRSHSFNPPRTAPGSQRSRRTLSLPAREKPMIPPMIVESPESLRRSHEKYSFTEQTIQENVYEISKLKSVNQRTFWAKSWIWYHSKRDGPLRKNIPSILTTWILIWTQLINTVLTTTTMWMNNVTEGETRGFKRAQHEKNALI